MNQHQNLPAVETANRLPQSQSNPPQRILVVEDDADIRQLNTEVLKRNGYQVDTAADGELAWKALTSQSYDLMITDNSMPKVTGLELLRKLRDASMPLPVIMATGVLPKGEFVQNPSLVPAATLQKPYTVTELLGLVKTVLHAADDPNQTAGPLPYGRCQPLPNRLPL